MRFVFGETKSGFSACIKHKNGAGNDPAPFCLTRHCKNAAVLFFFTKKDFFSAVYCWGAAAGCRHGTHGSQTGSHGWQGLHGTTQAGAHNFALRFKKKPPKGKQGCAQTGSHATHGSQTGSHGTASHGWQGSHGTLQTALSRKPRKKPPKGRNGRSPHGLHGTQGSHTTGSQTRGSHGTASHGWQGTGSHG
ncbi:MAG: hypothetical protein LBH00_05970 [Planctomycetaceae bacterium]|nr:hypothetical protein [Planctomycetaceae bacterium]